MTQKDRVSDQLFGARLCYFTTHCLVNLILLTYDCDLSIQIKEGRYFYPLLYLASTILAGYTYVNAGGNPGIVGVMKEGWENNDAPIELSEINSTSGHFFEGTSIEDEDFFQVHEH